MARRAVTSHWHHQPPRISISGQHHNPATPCPGRRHSRRLRLLLLLPPPHPLLPPALCSQLRAEPSGGDLSEPRKEQQRQQQEADSPPPPQEKTGAPWPPPGSKLSWGKVSDESLSVFFFFFTLLPSLFSIEWRLRGASVSIAEMEAKRSGLCKRLRVCRGCVCVFSPSLPRRQLCYRNDGHYSPAPPPKQTVKDLISTLSPVVLVNRLGGGGKAEQREGS